LQSKTKVFVGAVLLALSQFFVRNALAHFGEPFFYANILPATTNHRFTPPR
jgi:hypothetical protein